MTDMRRGRLLRGAMQDHNASTLSFRAHISPPPVAREFSNPSWKVIVSASHGHYFAPGSLEPGVFSSTRRLKDDGVVDRSHNRGHYFPMITLLCTAASLKKDPPPGTSGRRAR